MSLAVAVVFVSASLGASVEVGARVESRVLSPPSNATGWYGSLELDPDVAIRLGGRPLQLTAVYAPRITEMSSSTSPDLFHRAGIDVRWEPDRRTIVSTRHRLGYGSATLDAIGSAGQQGRTEPLPSQTLRYYTLDSRVEGSLLVSRRLSLAAAAALLASGGLDGPSRGTYPPLSSPEGRLSATWAWTREDTLDFVGLGRHEMASASGDLTLAGFQPAWRRRLSTASDARIGVGFGYIRFQPPLYRSGYDRVALLGSANLMVRGRADGDPATLTLSVLTQPMIDRSRVGEYQSVEASSILAWSRGRYWRLTASASGMYGISREPGRIWYTALDAGSEYRISRSTGIRTGLRAIWQQQSGQGRPFFQAGLYLGFETRAALDSGESLMATLTARRPDSLSGQPASAPPKKL